ncbi:MAG: PaaX family transcriptional regulator [Polyangiaceae bacterium]|nr:PaaX family transcriptional regulator [Polyangiaceae bacterium]
MAPRAQSLILDLLSAVGGRPVPVRALVRAAAVFGIEENALRVALARLLSAGKLEQAERGAYGLSSRSRAVQDHVTSWSTLHERVVAWRGGWVAVHVGALGRAQRSAVRRRERALEFLGCAELDPGLWLRPDNLAGGVGATRRALRELGLDGAALVARLEELEPASERRARSLWDGRALERAYHETRRELEQSGARLDALPLEQAVAECFVFGGKAIRQLAFDPLLPEPIVSADARQALVSEMRAYDRAGRRVWRRFMRAEGAPALESVLDFRSVEAT